MGVHSRREGVEHGPGPDSEKCNLGRNVGDTGVVVGCMLCDVAGVCSDVVCVVDGDMMVLHGCNYFDNEIEVVVVAQGYTYVGLPAAFAVLVAVVGLLSDAVVGEATAVVSAVVVDAGDAGDVDNQFADGDGSPCDVSVVGGVL